MSVNKSVKAHLGAKMTNGDINLLYAEVDRLLHDICKFLHDEIRDGYISPNGKNLANSLIDRSKKQLQTISMTVSLDTNESYVDMQAYKVNQRLDYPELEVYSDVSTYEPTSGLSIAGEDQIICPYSNLPASEIREGKMGHLYKKEKILFFEQHKKVFAAIYHAWFLIYANENALKPCQTFDLSRYEVKPSSAQSKDIKRRDESFDLMCISDSKLHQFTASTPKDMQQWLSTLKLQIDMIVTKRSLPPIPANKVQEDFFRISAELEGDHYEPLKNYMIKEKDEHHSAESLEVKGDTLPLPPRNPNKNIPKPYLPPASSEDSLSSNYDSVTPGFINPSRESSNSFSEDDSDTHYDDPSEITHRPTPINPNDRIQADDDEDDIYDCLSAFQESKAPINQHHKNEIQVPSPPSKVQSKPVPSLKPKLILSFRQRKKSEV
ncbi:hypothetical protein PPYR_05828 [Photinus pyralis]|uniref:PH domain-containing protein n=1 Tax=Photinus pyralis TaxID=7054 RepID=A0A5N4AVW4_PHOPY|nr:src kinase-associated phosphoprotein 2 [Photinus pyralis]KAB0801474.1 hypothetical protein PPYR_05828 [Photinus pyralis]